MLPPGLTAELLPRPQQHLLLRHHPDAQTAGVIFHGACSCDLIRYRHPITREDESHLRERYRAMGLPRDQVIQALERHRRGLDPRQKPEAHWPNAVTSFVAEHARNAGPTLYYLGFSHDGHLPLPASAGPIKTMTTAEVSAAPGAWLPEGELILVMPPPRTSS
jgi:hypothetical protein